MGEGGRGGQGDKGDKGAGGVCLLIFLVSPISPCPMTRLCFKSAEPTAGATTGGTPRQMPQRREPPHSTGSATHCLNGHAAQVGKAAHAGVLPNALAPQCPMPNIKTLSSGLGVKTIAPSELGKLLLSG
ncbi:MAG: hypothetical protein KME31_18305 [Tolypothrix carrinoi HA7290-LM1]|nr:hypothetical protein [Tolypothrix carrinoi HA7290-LM1]